MTGGSAAPGNAAGPRTGGGIALGDDLSRWSVWWRANRDGFLRLDDSRRRPVAVTGSDDFYLGANRGLSSRNLVEATRQDAVIRILPALKRLLDGTDNPAIAEMSVLALAKIGRDHPDFELTALLRGHLASEHYSVRQAAALALGISQRPGALASLGHLVLDSDAGRELTRQSSVDDRTRAFAAYGMGLVAWNGSDSVKRTTLRTMAQILRSERMADRDLRVAAVHAIGLLRPPRVGTLRAALDELDRFYGRDFGRGDTVVQAHVPTAVAKLLGRGNGTRHRQYKQLYCNVLTGTGRPTADNSRSAAIALGRLALPPELEPRDARCSEALLRYFRTGRDQQTRYLALIALGQIGGDANRTALLEILQGGNRTLERPWAALALGVMRHHAHAADERAEVDLVVGDALLAQFAKVRAPAARSAFAIALGLARHQHAAGELLAALEEQQHNEAFAGYVCIGLALMDCQPAKPAIQDLLERSTRRPERLSRAAIALGCLGDHDVSATLTDVLQSRSANQWSLAAVAVALGRIGDRRSIAPLLDSLTDTGAGQWNRAWTAAALGGIGDKETLPWNAKISADSNYRAAVETLAEIL